MVILLCQFGNETNTFTPGLLDMTMLAPEGWIPGSRVEEKFGNTGSYLGGALRAIREAGETPMPIDLLTNNGNFGAGPLMSSACAREAMDHICDQVRKKLGSFDGIYFALHGAGVCEFDQDLEGYTLQRLRDVVGKDMPIVCSLDLHGNVTHKMAALADSLYSIKEVPHNDCVDAGYRAAKHLIALIRGEEKPVMAVEKLPLLISPVRGSTLSGPGKHVKDYFAQYQQEQGLLDCSFIHGFSATDRECSSASVIVIADGCDPAPHAKHLARFVWQMREEFVKADISDAAGAVQAAVKAVKDGYVVINEASDNPGSGGPGDATHLLRQFLRDDLPGTIMGPVYDPETAKMLHTHKVGDRVDLCLGGRSMPLAGAPLEIKGAELLNLWDGKFISAAPINRGVAMDYGKSARLKKGNVEFIVVSVRYQTLDDRPFLMTGADLANYRIVGLKSMNHFRGYFASRADAIITADTPGARPANLGLYPYTQVKRPIYPLDPDTQY